MEGKKKVLLLWSGGLDSTYLLCDNLFEGNEVETVYLEIKNNERKVKREKDAIQKITEEIYRLKIGQHFERSLGLEVVLYDTNCLQLNQPLTWLYGLAFHNLTKVDEIQIGYCMNDDAISFIEDIKRVWEAYKPFFYEGEQPKLVFPLIKKKKTSMFTMLPESIRNMIVFCEKPNGDIDCGECSACKRAKNEGIFYNIERNQNPRATEDLKVTKDQETS